MSGHDHRPAPATEALDELDTPDGLRARLGLADPGRLPRVLAALGPRALRLARDRVDAAITYLVPPEHTAQARAMVGPDRALLVEQAVVVGADDEDARARAHVGAYLSTRDTVRAGGDSASPRPTSPARQRPTRRRAGRHRRRRGG
ncbi:hypothetical protein [Nocardia sp. NPDC057455]|uniref:hypothetical protein n=1 Tax=Nocardia sp. NPDC057455 TaxID=3346138 RepID=UPI00366EFC49